MLSFMIVISWSSALYVRQSVKLISRFQEYILGLFVYECNLVFLVAFKLSLARQGYMDGNICAQVTPVTCVCVEHEPVIC